MSEVNRIITRLDAYAGKLRQFADEADELSRSLRDIQRDIFLMSEGSNSDERI